MGKNTNVKEFGISAAQAALLLRAWDNPKHFHEHRRGDREKTMELLVKSGFFVDAAMFSEEEKTKKQEEIKQAAEAAKEFLPEQWVVARKKLEECAKLNAQIGWRGKKLTAEGEEICRKLLASGFAYDRLRLGIEIP